MASDVRITDGQVDFSEGVDSGRVTTIQSPTNPNGLKRSQLAWANNVTMRGGGILCRTGWRKVARILQGGALFQGAFMYDQTALGENPYVVVALAGRIYRVRVDTDNSVQDITGATPHPATEDMFFFAQGEEFLVIQAGDYSTLPLIWDGATMRSSVGHLADTATDKADGPVNEIPAAGPMDYYGGRFWYAIGRLYVAGDIVRGYNGTAPYDFRDSILKVTENYLAIAQDGFTVPTQAGNIRALKHTANLDTALGEGSLFPFTRKVVYQTAVPATRAEWVNTKEPIQKVAQINNGAYGDRCIVNVNGDLFYQSADGIRALIVAIRNFQQWGNIPISRNINRALQFNDRSLMRFASGIQFDNRMLQAILPEQTDEGVVFNGIAVMDFDLISSFESVLPPAWEGMWEGIKVLQLLEGDFGGRPRAFAVVRSPQSSDIELWELTTTDRYDEGDKGETDGNHRISWYFETPAYVFENQFELKKLIGGEIWIDKLYGTVEMTVEYRTDADPCWQYWFATQFCAARSSCEDVDNPVCYPEQPYREGYKFPITLPTPPSPVCKSMSNRPGDIGYQFQMRVTMHGWCRIRACLWYALPVHRAPYQGLTC